MRTGLLKVSSILILLITFLPGAIVALLHTVDWAFLSDLRRYLYVEDLDNKINLVILLLRVIIAFLGLFNRGFKLCMCIAIFLVIKDIVFIYFFTDTNLYSYLYRSIPELIVVFLYILGLLRAKYEEAY